MRRLIIQEDGMMFKNLANFAFERNWKEAIVFYLVYLVGILILLFMVGATAGGILQIVGVQTTYDQGFDIGKRAGNIAAIILCALLAVVILKKKGLHLHPLYILIAVLTALLALVAGALGGLVPCAYLTTRPIQKKAASGEPSPS